MSRSPAPLESLAKQVAGAQDRLLAELELIPQARRGFANRLAAPTKARRLWLLYAAAGVALAAGVILFTWNRALRLERESPTTARAPLTLRATASGGGGLVFSEGSTVSAASESSLRVEAVTAQGANIRLEAGALHASIVHLPDATWAFHAGPFSVAVLGTRFDLHWDSDAGSLTVDVEQGSIRLTGCAMADAVVTRGQRVTVRCVDGHAEVEAGPPQLSSSEPAASAERRHESGVGSSAPPFVSPPKPDTRVASVPSAKDEARESGWRRSIAQGHLREAYAAADREGFEQVCAAASAQEALDLSDGALLSGRADRAKQTLLLVRKRFPGSASSADAAYKLGRIAADQQGAMGDAQTWFGVYLQEAPGGALAREALGRLLEIDVSTGNVASARTRASEYLQRYPDGPHARLARGLIRP